MSSFASWCDLLRTPKCFCDTLAKNASLNIIMRKIRTTQLEWQSIKWHQCFKTVKTMIILLSSWWNFSEALRLDISIISMLIVRCYNYTAVYKMLTFGVPGKIYGNFVFRFWNFLKVWKHFKMIFFLIKEKRMWIFFKREKHD